MLQEVQAIIFKHSGTEVSRISHSNSTDLVFSTGSSVATALTLSGLNATFAGTIDSGAITSTGVIKSNRAEAQFELVSTHGRTSYINQGGGNLHIKAAHASGVGINYGDTTNPGLLKLYNNTTSKVTLDATNGDATFAGDIMPFTDSTNDIGSNSVRWDRIYGR